MGPVKGSNERLSDYRFRYARYSIRWLIGFGLATWALYFWAPSVHASRAPLVVLFFYVALPMATGFAVLAALVDFLRGGVSRFAERSAANAKLLERTTTVSVALVLASLFAFTLYLSIHALLTREVHSFTEAGWPLIAWATEPGWYVLSVVLWALFGVSGFASMVLVLRYRLRTAALPTDLDIETVFAEVKALQARGAAREAAVKLGEATALFERWHAGLDQEIRSVNAARVGTTSAVFVGIAVYLPTYFASGFLFYGQFVANLDTPLEALAALAGLQCAFLLLAWHISKMQISVDDPTWSPAYRERVKANLQRIKAEREAERPRDMRIFRRMSAMACVIFMVAYALGR